METKTRQEYIQRIQDGVAHWEQTCAQQPIEALEWQPTEDVWSIKQITFHVADGFEATIQRVQTILAQEHPCILSFDADQWSQERRYQQRPWTEAVESLRGNMTSFIDLISPLDNSTLERDGKQRNIANILGLPNEVLTIADLIRFEAMHVEEHFQAVEEIIGMFAHRKN